MIRIVLHNVYCVLWMSYFVFCAAVLVFTYCQYFYCL